MTAVWTVDVRAEFLGNVIATGTCECGHACVGEGDTERSARQALDVACMPHAARACPQPLSERAQIAQTCGLTVEGVGNVVRLRELGWSDDRIVDAFFDKPGAARVCLQLLDGAVIT